MEKIFESGEFSYFKYNPNIKEDLEELYSVGKQMKNALSHEEMVKIYAKKGDIILIKKDNEVVANTYVKDDKIQFLSGYRNSPIFEEDILKATYKYAKSLSMSEEQFRTSVVAYCYGDNLRRKQILDIVDTFEQEKLSKKNKPK